MLLPDGAKGHHMKRAFHKEQVNGKSIVKGESRGEKGTGAWSEPREQAKLTLQSI